MEVAKKKPKKFFEYIKKVNVIYSREDTINLVHFWYTEFGAVLRELGAAMCQARGRRPGRWIKVFHACLCPHSPTLRKSPLTSFVKFSGSKISRLPFCPTSRQMPMAAHMTTTPRIPISVLIFVDIG